MRRAPGNRGPFFFRRKVANADGRWLKRKVEFRHATVLAEETVRLLAPRSGEIYCDATLGGGGHAEQILEASAPAGRLVGIDRDPDALAAAKLRLERFGDRVTLVHGAFGDARRILTELGVAPVHGFVVDLGVSSPQLDRAERGFSFQREGPLDMRMDPTRGESAAELIARLDADELKRILKEYGEEKYAGRIARAVPTRERHKDPATRTFQALRIAVNDELGQLERFLEDFPSLLRPGGRIVVIAFHSLEDRLVKNRFRDLARHPGVPADLMEKMGVAPPQLELLTGKPVVAGEAELAANPRARSAKLRAAVRA